MTLIQDLQKDHNEILVLFNEIQLELNQSSVHEINSIIGLIQKIKNIIETHLQVEEENLYPILLDKEREDGIIDKHTHESQEVIEKFWEEQKDIGKLLINYIDKYSVSSNILDNPIKFSEETTSVIKKVQQRIEAEETYLFPLFLEDTFGLT
jgi:hypothetical protein